MKLTDSKFKEVIGEYFNYSMDWDFLDIVANILERIDLEDNDSIYTAMDDELIYTVDKWTVMEHYQTPETANFEEAWYALEEDIIGLVAAINKQ